MRLNRTAVWKVMTIGNSRELSLYTFERLDILCPRSDIHVKSYDHWNFSRAFAVQFRASRYIMRLNRTSEWKVMTISISREVSLFNLERLEILCVWIEHPSEMLWGFKFLESFCLSILNDSICYVPESDIRVKSYDYWNFSRVSVVQFPASQYIMRLNRKFEWKVLTIQICREFPLFHFERLDELCPRIGHLCEKIWPLNFLERFRCSISSVSIYR